MEITPRLVLEVVNAAMHILPEKRLDMIVDVVRSSGDPHMVYVVYADNTILPLRDEPQSPMAEPYGKGAGAIFDKP